MYLYIIHMSVHLCMQAHKLVDTELRKVMAPAAHLIDNTLQHTATHCNTVQHTAPHCNTLQHTATRRRTN